MTPKLRLCLFVIAAAGLVACYLWAFGGLPGFGNYPGPYGPEILKDAIPQTNAAGVVSAVNFDYRGFDTVGEEFILFTAAAGMSVVLRRLRGEREKEQDHSPADEVLNRSVPPTSSPLRVAALVLVGPLALIGWWLATHAQTSPSGGFQGGVIVASALMLVYLSGESIVFRRLSPSDLLDAAEAMGAGGFAAPGEDPRMAAEANEETGESESGRQRTPLTMLIPLCVLVLLGMASGIAALLPRFAGAVKSAAARFQDQQAYASLVLGGAHPANPVPLYPQVPPDVTAAAVITALGGILALIIRLDWRAWSIVPPSRRDPQP